MTTHSPDAPARPTVLLAEDDEDIRSVFELVLGERYDVRMAADAATLIEMARGQTPDVLLLDWTLPDAEGDDVVERLRSLGPAMAKTPLVIVSGASAVEAIARRHGALACPKPCDADALIGAIERALAARAG
jgi:CheY-like chemotaxis protein